MPNHIFGSNIGIITHDDTILLGGLKQGDEILNLKQYEENETF